VYLTRTTVSRGFFLVALPGGFVALILGRAAARAVLRWARRRGHCLHRVLAVGHPADVEHLIAELGRRDRHGLRVVGACVGTGDRVELACGVPIVGTPAGARRAAAEV